MHGRLGNDEVIASPDCFDYLDTKYVCLLQWALSVLKTSGIVFGNIFQPMATATVQQDLGLARPRLVRFPE